MIEYSRNRRVAAGFSLVEMAVVTLLIGIFLTMGLAAFRSTQDAQAVSRTQTRQAAIKDALIAYIRRHNRLPCADIDFTAPDGIENRGTAGDPTTPCATTPTNARFGMIPYVTLGLARDAAVDGWGNFFSYQVSNAAPTEAFNPGYGISYYNSPIPAPYRDWTLTANLRSGNTGELTINNRNAAGAIVTIASNAVAVVLSHGPNGFGAYTISGTRNTLPGNATDEYQNTNAGGGTTYYQRTQTTDDAATGGAFDDYVLYLTADDLLGPLFKDGTLKPPAAQLADTFTKIENAIALWAVTNGGSYGDSDCGSYNASWRCRVIPYADVYNGNTFMNDFYDGGVPWGTLNTAVPPGAPLLVAADVLDPWGRPIRYKVYQTYDLVGSISTNIAGAHSGIGTSWPPTNPAYTLTSFGPNRQPESSGGDDLSVTVTVADLRVGLTGAMP